MTEPHRLKLLLLNILTSLQAGYRRLNRQQKIFATRRSSRGTTYTVNINGENCSLHISNEVPSGTTLKVEAVADECFQFEKWSDNETANPRTINVTEDANLTAELNKLQYTITGKNDSEGGQVNVEEVNP